MGRKVGVDAGEAGVYVYIWKYAHACMHACMHLIDFDRSIGLSDRLVLCLPGGRARSAVWGRSPPEGTFCLLCGVCMGG